MSDAAVKSFHSWDDLRIAYREWGAPDAAGPPVVLHHGFVADGEANWAAPGIVDALVAAGHRVVAPDARGHGRSEKPHDPERYGEQRMARDLAALVEELGAPQVDLVGYSMGAIVALIYAANDGRVRRLVVGGVGSGVIECGGVDRRAVSNADIIEALQADAVEEESGEGQAGPRPASAFRRLADALGADREALVAQARAIFRGTIPLASIAAPTLVLAGDADPLAVRPEVLAGAIPDATLQLVEGDHMWAVADPQFTAAIVGFLS